MIMKYSGYIKNDIVDGVGVCVSFWVQGCTHHCYNCHNSQTWDFNGGKKLPKDYIEKILKACNESGILRNLSILGGEPFDNVNIIKPLIEKYKETYHDKGGLIFIWSGYRFEELMSNDKTGSVLELCDILIDGEYIDSKRDITLPLRGSFNQRIIDVKNHREIRGDVSAYISKLSQKGYVKSVSLN